MADLTFGSSSLRKRIAETKDQVDNPARQSRGGRRSAPPPLQEEGDTATHELATVGETATTLQKMVLSQATEQSQAGVAEGASNPATAIFQQGRRKLMSAKVAEAEYTTTDLRRSAAAVVEGSSGLWANIFQHVQSLLEKGWTGVMLGMRRKYDETPLTLRVNETRTDSQGEGVDSQSVQPSVTTKQVAKIMQTHVDVFMLLKRAGNTSEEPPQMVHLFGPMPTWLQCMPATKAPDIAESQMQFIKQMPGLQGFAEKFGITQHCVCTDRYSANLRAEKKLSEKMQHNTVHTTCNVHKLSSVEKSMGDIVSGQISGMVSVGLAMRQAGVVQEMRGLLKGIFSDELQIKVGPAKCEGMRSSASQAVTDFVLFWTCFCWFCFL